MMDHCLTIIDHWLTIDSPFVGQKLSINRWVHPHATTQKCAALRNILRAARDVKRFVPWDGPRGNNSATTHGYAWLYSGITEPEHLGEQAIWALWWEPSCQITAWESLRLTRLEGFKGSGQKGPAILRSFLGISLEWSWAPLWVDYPNVIRLLEPFPSSEWVLSGGSFDHMDVHHTVSFYHQIYQMNIDELGIPKLHTSWPREVSLMTLKCLDDPFWW